MQAVIEIPKFVYDMTKAQKKVIDADVEIVGKAIVEGSVLPDNATNGDVVKALFPNIDKNFSNVIDIKLWWNAPYKVGDTE